MIDVDGRGRRCAKGLKRSATSAGISAGSHACRQASLLTQAIFHVPVATRSPSRVIVAGRSGSCASSSRRSRTLTSNSCSNRSGAVVLARGGHARPADGRLVRVDAQAGLAPQRVLGVLEVAEEVREVDDAGGVRLGERDTASRIGARRSCVGHRTSVIGHRTSRHRDIGHLRVADVRCAAAGRSAAAASRRGAGPSRESATPSASACVR